MTNARHQATEWGRDDHRDHMRAHRLRKRGGVTDEHSVSLAGSDKVCVDASTSELAEERIDAARALPDAAANPTRDPDPRDSGVERPHAGETRPGDGAATPLGRSDARGGAVAVAGTAGARCDFCGRAGLSLPARPR